MYIKDKIASGLGSMLEWYDFALYGYFSPLIAQLYFPSRTVTIGMLKVFSVFAIGFIARPVGAIIFGTLSDKYGRTFSLKMMPILITIPTMIVSALPTYEQIGIAAPIILTMMRVCQGICIGGEYANNIVYLCESVDTKYKYVMGSIGSCTNSLGIFLASTIATIFYSTIPKVSLVSWGWRVAFSMSLFVAIATYILRRNMNETHVYKTLIGDNLVSKAPLLDSLRNQWRDYVLAFGVMLLPATAFYYVFMWIPNLLGMLNGNHVDKILADNSISLLARLFMIPMLGILADRIGGVIIARFASLLFILLSYPILYGILFFQNWASTFIIALAMLTTLNAATTPGLLISLTKPKTRCTMLSIIFNICFGVLGGAVPMISMLITDRDHSEMASVYYLIAMASITFVTTFFIKVNNYHE